MIEDKAKRINLKSKRTRTLFRKAIEVSQMCNLDIFILMKDRDSNKVIEYASIDANHQVFTLKNVLEILDKFKDVDRMARNFRRYTDHDYEALK